jgi:hypothetical protein
MWLLSEDVTKAECVKRAFRHGLWEQFTAIYHAKPALTLTNEANFDSWYDAWVTFKQPPVLLQLATRTHFRVNDPMPTVVNIGPALQDAIDKAKTQPRPIILPDGWSSNHTNPHNPKDSFELRRTMWESEQQEPSDPMPFVLCIIALITFFGWCFGMLCHWMIVR